MKLTLFTVLLLVFSMNTYSQNNITSEQLVFYYRATLVLDTTINKTSSLTNYMTTDMNTLIVSSIVVKDMSMIQRMLSFLTCEIGMYNKIAKSEKLLVKTELVNSINILLYDLEESRKHLELLLNTNMTLRNAYRGLEPLYGASILQLGDLKNSVEN